MVEMKDEKAECLKAMMIRYPLRTILAGPACGLGMWILGGLWHNLLLPFVTETAEAHHDGLGLALIAYVVLGCLIEYFYLSEGFQSSQNRYRSGVRIGALVGVLWVLPHGLVMAGSHGTSILYEVKNALYHVVEQGAGGLILAWILGGTRKT